MNSRSKGKRGELELSAVLREFGWDARRGQQRSGLDQADVIDGPPGWHLECKRVENLNVWKAFEQAQRDCPDGSQPLVAMRRNRSPWLAVIDLRVLLALLAGVELDPESPADSGVADAESPRQRQPRRLSRKAGDAPAKDALPGHPERAGDRAARMPVLRQEPTEDNCPSW
jgi:hypothetical protein